MAFIGDAIISASISMIIDQLASQDFLSFARRENLHKEMEKWAKTLTKLRAVLDDAEEKQLNNRLVKIWLSELQDLAYDVEDVLDEFYTEISRQQRLQQQQQASSSKVKRKILKLFSPLNPKRIAFDSKMDSKIKGITNRLQEIVAQKSDLDLKDDGSVGRVNKSFKRLASTSLLDEFEVYGREKDQEKIIEMLLSDQCCDDDGVCVLPIVGMGGIGKTTLAQLIYNDEKVMQYFDSKAWCCVSEDFDVVRVTKTILEAVTSENCDVGDLNSLQVRLRDRLVGKKFLIVLDDVWNENYHNWTLLRSPFQVRSPGSKVIVTTRSQRVGAIMGTVPCYILHELSFEASLSLFARHALGRRYFDQHSNLKDIGEQIVQRCKGLPLAVKTLGGLLRTKSNCDEWEDVLNSKIWDLSEDKSGILPALRLSYHHLPSHLKQLFVFCSIFPKDYEFYKDKLVLLWMAEGFLLQPGGKKQMKDLDSYFNELLSRSFFQRSSSNGSQFVMHDLIHDLALSVGGETCISLNSSDKLEDNKFCPLPERTRHLSFTRRTYEVSLRFKNLGRLKHLRTLLALPLHVSSWTAYCYLSNIILHEALLELRCLRVLSLNGYCLSEIPNSIGSLKHLRYLDLSFTKIKCLPESVCTLINLEILLLSGCRELIKLPQGIGNLINLFQLDISDTDKLLDMPSQIGKLTALQKLSKFIVGKDNTHVIRELKQLKNLQGKLCILGLENVTLENVTDVHHAIDTNLSSKRNLIELELQWGFPESRNFKYDRHVLNALQPHSNLKELKVSGYGGAEFPSWIGDPSFTKIVILELSDCRKCKSLPPLGGLPLLRNLCIKSMDAVRNIEFYGNGSSVRYFPSLEILEFKDMLEWESWLYNAGVDEEAEDKFPCLRELVLWNCPKLVGTLPGCLPSLAKLRIVKCQMLKKSYIRLPSLHELILEGCNATVLRNMVDVTSLTTLKITKMPELMCLGDWFLRPQGTLKSLTVSDCSSLMFLLSQNVLGKFCSVEHILIKGCPHFESLIEKGSVLPRSLESSACCKLEQLPSMVQGSLSLKYLYVESCPRLMSIQDAGILASVRHLVLRNCPAVEQLLNDLMMCSCQINNFCLEELEIEECPSFKCFPTSKLPSTLKELKIRYCIQLQSLPEGIMHNDNSSNILHLEHLEIIGCSSLTSFPPGKFPIQLKTLKIWDCSNLEPLSGAMLHDNTSLEYIGIWNYERLTSLPECPNSFRNLTELNISSCSRLLCFPESGLSLPKLGILKIYNCDRLKSLPNQMQNLTSLQELTICGCKELVSFPKWDLLFNLKFLEIWDCGLDGTLLEWNLLSLTSLRDFSIAGGCFSNIVYFPDEKFLLPTSLVSLWIGRLPNLEGLSKQLQNLSSLEELEILECPKLHSLPKKGLPPALGRLSIIDCSVLEQKYLKEKGVFWPIVAHIPSVEILHGGICL